MLRQPFLLFFGIVLSGVLAAFCAEGPLTWGGRESHPAAVNAVRVWRAEALLYGTGSDDAHWYPGRLHPKVRCAWTQPYVGHVQ